MAKATKQQVEIYAVVGLLCIAAVLGYFRFLRTPESDARSPSAAKGITPATLELPVLPEWLGDGPALSAAEPRDYAPPARDLFAPVKEKKVEQASQVEGARPDGLPVLSGTMRSGRSVLAILNGHVVGVGDRIGDYTVLRITDTAVELQRGDARTVITKSR